MDSCSPDPEKSCTTHEAHFNTCRMHKFKVHKTSRRPQRADGRNRCRTLFRWFITGGRIHKNVLSEDEPLLMNKETETFHVDTLLPPLRGSIHRGDEMCKFFCLGFRTRGPWALTVTWVSETLHWLLVRRARICISTAPSYNKWKSTMVSESSIIIP